MDERFQMTEAEINSISLFFFFILLDDQKALDASSQAVALFKSKIEKKTDISREALLVSVTKTIWDKCRARIIRGRNYSLNSNLWNIPEGLDLGPWKEFQKTASEDELLTLVWSKVLKISDQDISTALNITTGTVRYRLGRALRKMGVMTQNVVALRHEP